MWIGKFEKQIYCAVAGIADSECINKKKKRGVNHSLFCFLFKNNLDVKSYLWMIPDWYDDPDNNFNRFISRYVHHSSRIRIRISPVSVSRWFVLTCRKKKRKINDGRIYDDSFSRHFVLLSMLRAVRFKLTNSTCFRFFFEVNLLRVVVNKPDAGSTERGEFSLSILVG